MKYNFEEAVSPVVGVMLMLVVTIIIAAVVSAFAGGMGGSTEKTPQASIDAKITTSGGTNADQIVMTFEHLGGDPIPTKDMKIITYYTVPSTGKTIVKETTYKSRAATIWGSKVMVPFLNDASKGYAGAPAVDFGNFTFKSGDVLSTGDNAGTGTSAVMLEKKQTNLAREAVLM